MRASSGLTPTEYRYTGQMEAAELGLYFYVARWYDPYLNQFVQPDTIIPEPANAANWNRYAYANYNPIRYSDPSGHIVCEGIADCSSTSTLNHFEIAEVYEDMADRYSDGGK